MHYFAYGNLMDINVMRRIAPTATAVAVARLDDHQISFKRCSDPAQAGCTLDTVAGSETWGIQYELSAEDMATLDKAAGVPAGHWERKSVTLRDAEGAEHESTTYVIPGPSGAYSPPTTYVDPIFRGARDFDLPGDYVAKLEKIIGDAQKGA
ncbi:gamma-glutamylcyclotransferase [Microvirga pudoricolor]|uniref:gamma-glutamylcyclotransferase n=1 Tax=Microvirga pudoricolor TaxID=2778729 RepID=UPI001950C707|nr:gamma-glutamylcyclotransferase [Microvirga pudoricolor]MBM6595085.1 gamma-glutamylcyclotransferase [Microvirga pudoricolor]